MKVPRRLNTLKYITALAFEQLKRLDAVADALDTKAGVLFGFAAALVGISFSQMEKLMGWRKILAYIGICAHIMSMLMSICAVWPRLMRFDPDAKRLVSKYLDKPIQKVMVTVSSNIGDAWQHNVMVISEKSKRLRWAMLFLAFGVISLVIANLTL